MEEPALGSRELGYIPVLPSIGLEVSQLLAGAGNIGDSLIERQTPHQLFNRDRANQPY